MNIEHKLILLLVMRSLVVARRIRYIRGCYWGLRWLVLKHWLKGRHRYADQRLAGGGWFYQRYLLSIRELDFSLVAETFFNHSFSLVAYKKASLQTLYCRKYVPIA